MKYKTCMPNIICMYMHVIIIFHSNMEYMVQLKGNLTYTDRVYAMYWLKACGFINLYYAVREGKPAKINY